MKKLLGLFACLFALNASALHIPVIFYWQDNWAYDWTLERIVAENGEHDFTVFVDGSPVYIAASGIGGRASFGLFPPGGNDGVSLDDLNFFLHLGTHTVSLTYYDAGNNLIETVGQSYTVLPVSGDRPTTQPGSVPDGGATIVLLGLGLLGLALAKRHG